MNQPQQQPQPQPQPQLQPLQQVQPLPQPQPLQQPLAQIQLQPQAQIVQNIDAQLNYQHFQYILNTFSLILFIIEIVYLSEDEEIKSLNAILIIWLISIILSFAIFVKYEDRSCKIFFIFMYTPFRCEWLLASEKLKKFVAFSIIQSIFVFFPINIINMILIFKDAFTDWDYTVSNDNYSFYVAAIFLGQMFIGITLINGVELTQRDINDRFYGISISQVCMNFSYWYIIMQCFLYNYVIGIVLLISNIFFLAAHLMIIKNYSKNSLNFDRIFQISIAHLYQFQCQAYSIFNYKDFFVNNWEELISPPIQIINIIILFVIKMVYFPYIFSVDIGLFVLLFFSIKYIRLIIYNTYYTLKKKVNKIEINTKWNYQELLIEKKEILPLIDDFIYEYSLNIELDLNSQDEKELKKLQPRAQILSKLMHKGMSISFKNSIVNVTDPINELQLKFCFFKNTNLPTLQSIELSKNEEKMKKNLILLQNLDILINPFRNIHFKINKQFIFEIPKLLIQLQMINNITYSIVDYDKPEEIIAGFPHVTDEEFKNILNQIKQNYLEFIAFQRTISNQLDINPGLVFYDLHFDYQPHKQDNEYHYD